MNNVVIPLIKIRSKFKISVTKVHQEVNLTQMVAQQEGFGR